MMQHVAQQYVKRKLGMQQGGRFQEALEFDQAAARRLRAGDVLHAREQLGKRIAVSALDGAEDDLVRVVETEGNRVAILQFAAIDFLPVHEEAATLAAILDIEAIGLDDRSGAAAGDAAIGWLEAAPRSRAPPEHERRLR